MHLPPKEAALAALMGLVGITDTPTYDGPGPRPGTPDAEHSIPAWHILLETAVPRSELMVTDRDREAAAVFGLPLDEPDTSETRVSAVWSGRGFDGTVIGDHPTTPGDPIRWAQWLTVAASRIHDPWMPVAIRDTHHPVGVPGAWLRAPEPLIETMRRHGDTIRGPQAAQIAHVTPATWRRYHSRGLTPAPIGETPHGYPLWSRAEVEQWQAHRPGRGTRTDLH